MITTMHTQCPLSFGLGMENRNKFFRKIDKQVDNDTHANKRWAELTINDADDARIQ